MYTHAVGETLSLGTYKCTSNVTVNPRRAQEEKLFEVGVHVDYMFHPYDEASGAYHVGGKDCTHYCMPGIPDLTAMRLVRELAENMPPPAKRRRRT